MMEDKRMARAAHTVNMEDRQRLSITGVSEIDMFDEYTVSLFTQMGGINVRGTGLHIISMSVDSGEILIEGNIDGLEYTESGESKSGFFSRLFK